jgi:DNA-binding LacI/PurR family transcriptional regulator
VLAAGDKGWEGSALSAKRITSQDVADLAGVSRTTVSLVLNDVQDIKISPATRQRVINAAEELGYVPDAAAQALASRRAQIIGFILTRQPHQIASDAFIPQILDGLLDVMHQYDMRLIIDIVEPEHQNEAYLQLVRAKRIDGFLLSGPRLGDSALKALEQDGFPTVLIGQLPDVEFCSVDIDNRAAARKAVAHLVNLGHRRIACITNAPKSYTAPVDRLAGYRLALEDAGIAYRPELVRYGNFTLESGYEQMGSLLASGEPFTAVFVASDTVALGAKAAILEHGLRVPRDIALVGFDDLPIAQYAAPPLTTIHLPVIELARQASEMLINILKGEQLACRHILLDAHLVIRQSCGATNHR